MQFELVTRNERTTPGMYVTLVTLLTLGTAALAGPSFLMPVLSKDRPAPTPSGVRALPNPPTAPRAQPVAPPPLAPAKPELKPEPKSVPPAVTAKPPVAAKPPAPPATPPVPRCSGRTADVKQMVSKVLDTNVFNLTWREKSAAQGASFRVMDTAGAVRIEMISKAGVSIGVAPAMFCVENKGGWQVLTVGLQRSSLSFGTMYGFIDVDGIVDEKLAATRTPGTMFLIVSRGVAPGDLHVKDGLGAQYINNQFTATDGRATVGR